MRRFCALLALVAAIAVATPAAAGQKPPAFRFVDLIVAAQRYHGKVINGFVTFFRLNRRLPYESRNKCESEEEGGPRVYAAYVAVDGAFQECLAQTMGRFDRHCYDELIEVFPGDHQPHVGEVVKASLIIHGRRILTVRTRVELRKEGPNIRERGGTILSLPVALRKGVWLPLEPDAARLPAATSTRRWRRSIAAPRASKRLHAPRPLLLFPTRVSPLLRPRWAALPCPRPSSPSLSGFLLSLYFIILSSFLPCWLACCSTSDTRRGCEVEHQASPHPPVSRAMSLDLGSGVKSKRQSRDRPAWAFSASRGSMRVDTGSVRRGFGGVGMSMVLLAVAGGCASTGSSHRPRLAPFDRRRIPEHPRGRREAGAAVCAGSVSPPRRWWSALSSAWLRRGRASRLQARSRGRLWSRSCALRMVAT